LAGTLVLFPPAPARAADDEEPEEPKAFEIVKEEVRTAPESSFQTVVVGTVVSADRQKHTLAVMDKRRQVRVYYANPGVPFSFDKGTTVQMRLRPGSTSIESIQKISG
jgi:hypothetical protein